MAKSKSAQPRADLAPGPFNALTPLNEARVFLVEQAANGQRLTTPQIARRYQVTPRTIQTWRDEGRIPFLRINSRCIRYDPDAVEKALSNNRE